MLCLFAFLSSLLVEVGRVSYGIKYAGSWCVLAVPPFMADHFFFPVAFFLVSR